MPVAYLAKDLIIDRLAGAPGAPPLAAMRAMSLGRLADLWDRLAPYIAAELRATERAAAMRLETK